jgi:hypothetical protein
MQHLLMNTVSVSRKRARMNETMEQVGQVAPVMSGVSCRIAPGSGRRVVQVGAEQVVSSHTMISTGEEGFQEGDLVTDEKGKVYEVILVRPCYTATRYHHTECDMIYRQGN